MHAFCSHAVVFLKVKEEDNMSPELDPAEILSRSSSSGKKKRVLVKKIPKRKVTF